MRNSFRYKKTLKITLERINLGHFFTSSFYQRSQVGKRIRGRGRDLTSQILREAATRIRNPHFRDFCPFTCCNRAQEPSPRSAGSGFYSTLPALSGFAAIFSSFTGQVTPEYPFILLSTQSVLKSFLVRSYSLLYSTPSSWDWQRLTYRGCTMQWSKCHCRLKEGKRHEALLAPSVFQSR